jgi:hypothetical protein
MKKRSRDEVMSRAIRSVGAAVEVLGMVLDDDGRALTDEQVDELRRIRDQLCGSSHERDVDDR